MQVLVLDEFRQRGSQIAEKVASGSGAQVVACQITNEFMTALGQGNTEKVIVDVPTWNSGRAIYTYFGVAARLETVPVVFYNAPEGFETLAGRPRHNLDRVLSASCDSEAVVEAALSKE